MEMKQSDKNDLIWRAPHEGPFKLAGFHWFAQDRVYRRLPIKPPQSLPPAVERLSWCCAGGQVKFTVVSKVRFSAEALKSEKKSISREKYKAFQKNLVNKLRAIGDKHIHFLDGSRLLGGDYHECSVDGVHPTDLGFFRMANNMRPALAKLLFA